MKTKHLLSLLLAFALCSDLAVCRRGGGRSGGGFGGGLFGGRKSSSSRRGSSWFGSSSRSKTPSNSYPKQQYGTGSKSNSYPKQQWGTNTNSKPAIGGGGFVNPKTSNGYGTKYGYGSNFNSRGGVGGSSIPTYSYRSPGYGTRFGTSFPGGMGRYGGAGYSRKSLGMGVGAGFLGGAAVGMVASYATMNVYHRYQMYNRLMYMNQYGGRYNDPYYNNYYSQGRCMGGCPMHSRCEYGFCECYAGYLKGNGQCYRDGMNRPGREANFDPFQPCMDASSCQRMDINLICNTNLTTSTEGRCECRKDMKWNDQGSECQFYLDIDCTAITYDTKPSPIILEAVNKTLEDIGDEEVDAKPIDANSTITPDESLQNSLLSNIDPEKASQTEIKEAFCRDVDSFSWEFGSVDQQNQNRRVNSGSNTGSTIGIGVLIAMLIFACCVCSLVVKCFKKAKAYFSGPSNDDHRNGKDITGLDEMPNHPVGAGVIPNPGYQPQPTPIHNLPYAAQPTYPTLPPTDTSFQNPYEDPAPIPPTQPGYTNFPPIDVNAQPSYPPQPVYPPQPNQNQYPPPYQQDTPYMPTNNPLPYPPTNNPAPYPPTNNQAYPPYPVVSNTNPPPYNPTAP